MAKRLSFADKALKKKQVVNCSVCGSPVVATKVVFPQQSAAGSVKYKTDIVKVCKCNHKDIYG